MRPVILSWIVLLGGSALLPALQVVVAGDEQVRVGSVLALRASEDSAAPGSTLFRYRVRAPKAAGYRTVRDFSTDPEFAAKVRDIVGLYTDKALCSER